VATSSRTYKPRSVSIPMIPGRALQRGKPTIHGFYRCRKVFG